MVGLTRLELVTPRLSSVCSNQLSYRPNLIVLFGYRICSAKPSATSLLVIKQCV